MSKKITISEALGPQHKGCFPVHKLEGLTDAKVRELYEYRKDVVEKIDPRLGLSFAPDSTLPWLNPLRVKINLGSYRAYSVEGWLNVCDPSDPHPQAEFTMPLDLLRLKEGTVDFINAPFIIHKFENPLNAVRNWLSCLRPTGCLFIAIEDQYEKMKLGLRFDLEGPGRCWTEEPLRRLMLEAGCKDMTRANFDKFDLIGSQPYYRGYFGWKT